MELALQFEDVFSYEAAEPLVSAHEEVMETAIPEYCPDIARIVDTVGHISIHEKTLNAGKAAISGSVKVTILYTSEEADGLRSMGVSVPFSCVLENRALEKCTVLCTSGRVLLAEARATTSRKLYIKVLPEITAIGYRPTKHRICTGTEEEQKRWLRGLMNVRMPKAVSAEDTFPPPCQLVCSIRAPSSFFVGRWSMCTRLSINGVP